jgi:hypothetical protein
MSEMILQLPSQELIAARAGALALPETVIFEHRHWRGASYRTNLNVPWVGDWWNDKISGIIVVSGTWRFYEHRDYGGQHWDLGTGYYEFISDFGIPNDVISSFQVIAF